jgi:hypothetical protein
MLCVLRAPHNYHMGKGAVLELIKGIIKGRVIRDLLYSTKLSPWSTWWDFKVTKDFVSKILLSDINTYDRLFMFFFKIRSSVLV